MIRVHVNIRYPNTSTRTHTRTHTCTHTDIQTHTHTHTHTQIKHSIDANGNFAISVFNMHNEVFHIKPLPYSVIMWWGKILAN